MNPEIISIISVVSIISVGAVIIGLILQIRQEARENRKETRAEIALLQAGMTSLRERMARLEGLIEGLREAITARVQ